MSWTFTIDSDSFSFSVQFQRGVACVDGLSFANVGPVKDSHDHADIVQLDGTAYKLIELTADNPNQIKDALNPVGIITSDLSHPYASNCRIHLDGTTYAVIGWKRPGITVDWGDGMVESYNTNQTISHSYSSSQLWNITITGICNRIRFGSQQADKITSIDDLNTLDFLITDMGWMFDRDYAFNQPLGVWDVSNVTNMVAMFRLTYAFNQPIGDWDVSNVTNMRLMFGHAYDFNQPIGGWDVSNVTNMGGMFRGASDFLQGLSGWNVDNVTDWRNIFRDCPMGDRHWDEEDEEWVYDNIHLWPEKFRDNPNYATGN